MTDKPSHIVSLVAAVLSVSVAWGLRWIIAPALGGRLPFITFFPMLFVVAWWGGLWPTAYAAILAMFVLCYAILEPVGSFYVELPEYRVELGIFLIVAGVAAWLGEHLHKARKDRQQAVEIAIAEGEQLRLTISEREHAEQALTFLADASTKLAALVDRQSALQQAARLPVPF